jgi:hypothetical protein
VNRLLIVPGLAVLLSGCSLGASRDVRAYNTCLARHPQDVVVCEGPRQAYETEPSTFQAISAPIRPTDGYGYEEGLPVPAPPLAPVPLRPAPVSVSFGLNGQDPCMALGLTTTACK